MLRLLFVLLLSFGLLTGTHATTLKIATIAPDGTSWMKQLRTAAKKIQEETQGRIKIRFYPGGVMGNDKSVLRKIRVGQLQGGAITGGGLTSIHPDTELYSLPFLFRNLQEVDHVRRVMDEQIIGALREKGFTSYGISEGGFAYLMSNQPVKSTHDLKGLKIWIPEGDKTNARAFNTLDISPIQLPITDVLTGLQTGLINTVATSAIGAIALQWHTRVKYLTDVPLAYLYASLVIKESALRKLSTEDRGVLQRIMDATFAELNQKNRGDGQSAVKALTQQGIRLIQPSSDERRGWEKHAALAIEDRNLGNHFSRIKLQQIQTLIQESRTQPNILKHRVVAAPGRPQLTAPVSH
ncbi:MAG: TRAP transporter substrate-binding protein DctP [Pseudomonadota bacterium]